MSKIFLYLLLLPYVKIFFPSPTFAANDYDTTFVSTYTVNHTNTEVKHEISLQNKLKHLYPTKYTIQLDSPNLQNIESFQDSQPVEHSIAHDKTTTTISLPQLRPVIGLDQTTKLEISYTTRNLTEKLGKTWSINIPRLSRANEIKEFTRVIRIPIQLGLPSSQYPPATAQAISADGLYTLLTFHGYPNHSISLLFGEQEHYLLKLKYYLVNPTLSAAETELALPPETAYQQVILDELSPPPLNVHLDQDGNWLAVYSLKSKEELLVEAKLYLTVTPLPSRTAPLAEEELYLQAQPYWDLESDQVTSVAEQLSTPESIFDYLVQNFTYSSDLSEERPLRQGAATALATPHHVSNYDFADSFVTLARAKGIPARLVSGYVSTTNSALRPTTPNYDSLHVWAEYYDQEAKFWYQVDPTWSSTTGGVDYFHKLDFNHLTFVIQGSESTYPYPAGTYKNSDNNQTLEVSLVDELPPIRSQLEKTTFDHKLVLENTGNVAAYDPQVGFVLPYGKAEINTSLFSFNSLLPRLLPPTILLAIVILVGMALHRLKKSS